MKFIQFINEAKECKECGGGIMKLNYEKKWECANCGHVIDKQKYERKMSSSGFTVLQDKTIDRIKKKFLEYLEGMTVKRKVEYKKWEVKKMDWGGGVAEIYCVAGDVGDEGTMLAALGRTNAQIFVNPNGSVSSARITSGTREVEKKYHKLYGV